MKSYTVVFRVAEAAPIQLEANTATIDSDGYLHLAGHGGEVLAMFSPGWLAVYETSKRKS